MIYVRPKHGLRVRHPEQPTTLIPKEGLWINESTALTRLINDGDLLVDKAKSKEQPPTNSKGKAKDSSNQTTDTGEDE